MEDVQKYKLRSLSNITTYIIFRVVLFFVFPLTVGWKINDILIYFCAVQGCMGPGPGRGGEVFTFTYTGRRMGPAGDKLGLPDIGFKVDTNVGATQILKTGFRLRIRRLVQDSN